MVVVVDAGDLGTSREEQPREKRREEHTSDTLFAVEVKKKNRPNLLHSESERQIAIYQRIKVEHTSFFSVGLGESFSFAWRRPPRHTHSSRLSVSHCRIRRLLIRVIKCLR